MMAISQETTQKIRERAVYLATLIGKAGSGEDYWDETTRCCYIASYLCAHIQELTETIRSLAPTVAAMVSERKEDEQ